MADWLLDRRHAIGLLVAAPTIALARPRTAAASLCVATSGGWAMGRAIDGIRVFTGIPYGRATRFAPAQPAPRWSGTLDATRPAAVAPQSAAGPAPGPPSSQMTEDCLQLNVWAPLQAGPHPVIVYIHGGANDTGWSGEQATTGDRFAAHGIVFVTVNYRVGALGFLELGELLGPAFAGSGNNGLRDLLLALHWVRANISAFGGDPHRVTIAGESAGGKNVVSLMGCPAADGLYARAAVFSGGGQTVHQPAEAHAFAKLLAEQAGGAGRLHEMPVEALLVAQAKAKAVWPRNFPFRPVIDGRLLPQVPLDRIRAAKCRPVPLLIGTNADESRVFLPSAAAAAPLTSQSVANETMDRMARLDSAYATVFPDLAAAERNWRLLTAEEYGMPCLRIAEAHAARGAPVWRYRLAYPAPGGPFRGHSPHVLDVPFFFDHVRLPGFGAFFGIGAPDQWLADAMHTALITFAGKGFPESPGLPAWRRFSVPERATMLLDRKPSMVSDPDRHEREIWNQVAAQAMPSDIGKRQ